MMSSARAATYKILGVAGNSRGLFGLTVVALITGISLTFNWQLGVISGFGDDVSGRLMPGGYALIDLAALFIIGYIGYRTKNHLIKALSIVWFLYLISLSLWAAMSYAISVDYRVQNQDTDDRIAAQQAIVDNAAKSVETWQNNVATTPLYRTRYQGILDQKVREHQMALEQLNAMRDKDLPPAMAIYYKVAPMVNTDPENMATIMRLLWSAALTLTPIVLMLIIGSEFVYSRATESVESTSPTGSDPEKQPAPKPKQERETSSEFPAQRATQRPVLAPVPNFSPATAQVISKKSEPLEKRIPEGAEGIDGIKGNNQHTDVLDLNGLKKARAWLDKQPIGRINRTNLKVASGIKTREGVSKIIRELINNGELVRLANKQLSKPAQKKSLLKTVSGR